MEHHRSDMENLVQVAVSVVGAVIEPARSDILSSDDDTTSSKVVQLKAMVEGVGIELTLKELECLDPNVGQDDRANPKYMTVHQMKAERVLRGDTKVPAHSNRAPHVRALLKLREKAASEERAKTMAPEKWDEKDEILEFGQLLPKDSHGKPVVWGNCEYARLAGVVGHPDCFEAMRLLNVGYRDKATKRIELDDSKQSRDPWPIIRELFESEMEITHPCPKHPQLGLSEFDPNACHRTWPEEILKGKYGLMRSDCTLVRSPYEASGQGDPEKLAGFLHFGQNLKQNQIHVCQSECD